MYLYLFAYRSLSPIDVTVDWTGHNNAHSLVVVAAAASESNKRMATCWHSQAQRHQQQHFISKVTSVIEVCGRRIVWCGH